MRLAGLQTRARGRVDRNLHRLGRADVGTPEGRASGKLLPLPIGIVKPRSLGLASRLIAAMAVHLSDLVPRPLDRRLRSLYRPRSSTTMPSRFLFAQLFQDTLARHRNECRLYLHRVIQYAMFVLMQSRQATGSFTVNCITRPFHPHCASRKRSAPGSC